MSITRRELGQRLAMGGVVTAAGLLLLNAPDANALNPNKDTKLVVKVGDFEFTYHGLRREFFGDRFSAGFGYVNYLKNKQGKGVVRETENQPEGHMRFVTFGTGGHDLAYYTREAESVAFINTPKLEGGVEIPSNYPKHWKTNFNGRLILFSADKNGDVSARTLLCDSAYNSGVGVSFAPTEVKLDNAWEVSGNRAIPPVDLNRNSNSDWPITSIIQQGNQPGVIAYLFEGIPFKALRTSD